LYRIIASKALLRCRPHVQDEEKAQGLEQMSGVTLRLQRHTRDMYRKVVGGRSYTEKEFPQRNSGGAEPFQRYSGDGIHWTALPTTGSESSPLHVQWSWNRLPNPEMPRPETAAL